MKIPNNAIATAPIAHAYELSDYMVISGAMYNKNPMYPLPLKYGILEDANSSVYFKETYDVTEKGNTYDSIANMPLLQRANKCSYVVDNTNPKIHWCFYNDLGLFKITETNEGLKTELIQVTSTNMEKCSFEFVMQTDQIIVFNKYEIYASGSSYYRNICICIFDKSTCALKKSYSSDIKPIFLGYYYDKIEETYYLHCIVYQFNNNNTNPYKNYSINLTSFTETNLSISGTSFVIQDTRLNTNVINESIEKSFFLAESVNYTSRLNRYRVTGARNGENIVLEIPRKITGISNPQTIIFRPEENYYGFCTLNPVAVSNKACIFTCYNGENNIWNENFEINVLNDVDISNVYTAYNYTVCGKIGNDKTIFFANHECVAIYKWDTLQKTYVLYNTIFDNVEKVCIDANDNFWIYNANKDLYIPDFDHFDYNVTLEVDETDYDYNDQDIQANVRVKCIDVKGNHVKINVKLKITGVAKFTENNKQEIEVSLNGEEMIIPITIFGKGTINIAYIE